MLFERFLILFRSLTTGLHASKVKKHFHFLIKYTAHHIYQWISNDSSNESVSNPSFLRVCSALIGQTAQSFVISLPLTAQVVNKLIQLWTEKCSAIVHTVKTVTMVLILLIWGWVWWWNIGRTNYSAWTSIGRTTWAGRFPVIQYSVWRSSWDVATVLSHHQH